VSNITETLEALAKVDGALSAALVDGASGMLLGEAGSGFDLEVSAAEVVSGLRAGGLGTGVEEILLTLKTQYRVIRPLASNPEAFLYLVLDSGKANLALARLKVKEADLQLEL
jgi:hypothetical protein